MGIIYIVYVILQAIGTLTLARPFEEEKTFTDDKFNCMDSNEGFNYAKNNQNFLPEVQKSNSKFEGSNKYMNKLLEYDKKRYANDDLSSNYEINVQKRQVGVIYKDDQPIGILQPYQRSYRFIPVKDSDDSYSFGATQDSSLSGISDVNKREINIPGSSFDGNYPSILTNFKIVDKLDKKRNYDSITDENVEELKATIRRLRSSNPHNSEQIEEKLKSILDDMGLIETDENHGEKREIKSDRIKENNESLDDDSKLDQEERQKREQNCIQADNMNDNNKFFSEDAFSNEEKRNEIKTDVSSHANFNKRENVNEPNRKKRQKQEIGPGLDKDTADLVENLKSSGELMISGNKSPLASSSEIATRDAEDKEVNKRSYTDDTDDYEKRVERQIQSRINSLKEEVKREIEDLKKSQNVDDDEDEDTLRRKRQATDTLINEESDDLNPALHPDNELKPLIRKRRHINTMSFNKRKRRRSDHVSDLSTNTKNYKTNQEEYDDGGELLGGDDFENGAIFKRQAPQNKNEMSNLNDQNKRSGSLLNNLDLYNYLYDNYFYNTDRLKRQNTPYRDWVEDKPIQNKYLQYKPNQWKSRFRRRINDNILMVNRPQQLSDMSDLDLFGALPKSYDGELTRYKRVK